MITKRIAYKENMLRDCTDEAVLEQILLKPSRPRWSYVNRDTSNVKNNLPCGYCWCSLHQGFLSCKLMKKHECLKKSCKYLERFDAHPFWKRQEKKARDKARRKAIQKGLSTYRYKDKVYYV